MCEKIICLKNDENNFAYAIKWPNEAREISSALKEFIIIYESPSKIALITRTSKENSSAFAVARHCFNHCNRIN